LCLPILLILMVGMWQVGRLVQVSQILNNAARSGARYAAMGSTNLNGVNTPITAAMVQKTVSSYLLASGLPPAVVNETQIQVLNLSGNNWTDPGSAQPMDQFQVQVTILPAGFSNLLWSGLMLSGTENLNQLSSTATWVSLVDSQVSVNTQLPY